MMVINQEKCYDKVFMRENPKGGIYISYIRDTKDMYGIESEPK